MKVYRDSHLKNTNLIRIFAIWTREKIWVRHWILQKSAHRIFFRTLALVIKKLWIIFDFEFFSFFAYNTKITEKMDGKVIGFSEKETEECVSDFHYLSWFKIYLTKAWNLVHPVHPNGSPKFHYFVSMEMLKYSKCNWIITELD